MCPDLLGYGFSKVMRDVTDRMRAGEALRKWAHLFEHARWGVAACNADDDSLEMVNPAFAAMHGYTVGELTGRPVVDVFAPEFRAEVPAHVRTANEAGHHSFEAPNVRKDGSVFPALVNMTAVKDAGGRVLYRALHFQDISDRRRIERERADLLAREQAARLQAEASARQAEASARQAEALAREAGRAREEAERAREAAEAANRAKDEFLATVSHELRTPLTAMLGWARMLRGAECDPDTLNEGLDTIERNANAQAQLIDDILDISRIITGKLRMNVGPTDLGPVVHEALDAVRPAADARGIRLKVHLDGGGGGGRSPAGALVSGDPVRLQQVVWNLLSNAIKFTPRGGTVSVTIDRAESRARIVVTDTGRGITPDFLPYVFDRFRQADASSTRRHGGLGLGLSIVRHLVELHGGTIDAHSDGEGKGATFTVALPLMAARPDFPPRATGHAEVGSSPPSPSSQPLPALECPPVLAGLRVLVVDDEPDARRLLAAVLGRCKAEVATAGGVAEALGEIDRARPHVLVSDIGMPDEDGYSLIRRVRQWDAAAGGHTPAIALTAYTRPADRVRVLSAGFQAYLPKPVEPAELVAAVASLAGRHMGAAGADGKAAGW